MKHKNTGTPLAVISTETPFNQRRFCWFCGEPNDSVFHWSLFAQEAQEYGKTLSVPSCQECHRVATSAKHKAKYKKNYQHFNPPVSLSVAQSDGRYTIWELHKAVKDYLLTHYRKDLAIGVNWTKEELEGSEFESGNFSGFKKSAWFMYEVAKGRLNFKGWPLVIDGKTLSDDEPLQIFSFDGVEFENVEAAIRHYAQTFSLQPDYFRKVVQCLGDAKFSQAVRFSRLLINATYQEKQVALKELQLTMAEST
jgi:hypothetical protein